MGCHKPVIRDAGARENLLIVNKTEARETRPTRCFLFHRREMGDRQSQVATPLFLCSLCQQGLGILSGRVRCLDRFWADVSAGAATPVP